jgi:hypothetical protein
MKLSFLTLCCVVAAIAVSPVLTFAGTFEGIITFQSTRDGAQTTMTYSVKGNQTRIDIPAAAGHPSTVMLVDGATNKKTVFFEQMKAYMEHDMASSTATAAAHPPVNTGKTETILGHPCEIWEGESSEGMTVQLWLATDFQATFAVTGAPSSKGGETPAARFMREQHRFPLRFVEHSGTKEVNRTEAIKIEPKSISAGLFVVPDGFKKMDMHGMH